MPYLSPEAVNRWSKAKKNLSDWLAKGELPPGMGKSTIDDLKKKLEAFDSGLTPKLKKAATAKNDKDAVLAIGEGLNIIKSYKAKVSEWKYLRLKNQATAALTEVQTACENALVQINKDTPRR